jgi:NAD(P)-dependent dehydrogenase (short-subunit alcohol dehydrogenase family)
VNGITKSTAVFYKANGIRANAVAPGPVATYIQAPFKSEHAAGVLGPGRRPLGADGRRPQGFAWLPEDDFVNHFAADVDPVKARVMFAVQQPLHWSDQVIPPVAQRQLFAPRMGATTVEVSTNHVAMVSHPDEVLQLIRTAVEAASR